MNNSELKQSIAVIVSKISTDFCKEKDPDGFVQRSSLEKKAPVILDYFLRHNLIARGGLGFDEEFRLWLSTVAALSTDREIEQLHKETLIIQGLSDGAIDAKGFLEKTDRGNTIGLLKMWFDGKKKHNLESQGKQGEL